MKYYQKKKWQVTRNQGKGIYILQYGGLRGILISVILFSFLNILPKIANGTLSYSNLQEPVFLENFLLFFIFGFSVGCAFGWFSWLFKEEEYKKS